MIIEACVENINEALRAESLGANRVEICENLRIGGTTPSSGTIQVAKQILKIPIMVLIRPRGGNFIYSDNEIEIMKYDIKLCKQIGVDGVVIGALTKSHTIDIELVEELTELAKPMDVTFNKAIDKTNNIIEEFRRLLDTDVDRVLTSGGAKTALNGRDIINQMVNISDGKIKIISAGKIHHFDLPDLQNMLTCTEFHGKKIVGNLSNINI